MKYYLAYGSNLNLEQMKYRCPGARVVGTSEIKDYRLMFKGSRSGSYLTIEKAVGHTVPVGVFAVSDQDEKNLDRYEGYPNFYYKKNITVDVKGLGEASAFVYIMHEDRPFGIPSIGYVNICADGYDDFGFNQKILDEAIRFTIKEIRKWNK